MRVPSSTPTGMVTDKVRSRVTRPKPLQDGHGVSIVSPRPWQDGQVRSMVKKPWVARTLPMPPQVRQVVGAVPVLAPEPEHASQMTEVGTRICAALPL
jgi:hypothetical protein